MRVSFLDKVVPLIGVIVLAELVVGVVDSIRVAGVCFKISRLFPAYFKISRLFQDHFKII